MSTMSMEANLLSFANKRFVDEMVERHFIIWNFTILPVENEVLEISIDPSIFCGDLKSSKDALRQSTRRPKK